MTSAISTVSVSGSKSLSADKVALHWSPKTSRSTPTPPPPHNTQRHGGGGEGDKAAAACHHPSPHMRQLLLLRHAKSSWDDPQLSDHARPINLRGRQAAAAMAAEIKRLRLNPDLVLVSSARRTLQTLAALDPWDNPPRIEPMDALYLASQGDLLDVLRGVAPAAQCVLLVGHNPGLHELAMLLAQAHAPVADKQMQRLAAGYPSGALCEFAVAVPWSGLGDAGARLTRFLVPTDLTAMTV